MNKYIHEIAAVIPGSIAEECGLEPGDKIVAVNDKKIEDIFDYQYYIEEEVLRVQILTKDGEDCMLEIEKEEDEDLGIEFTNSLMDEYHSCSNKCIFCFIDQMPPGMRDTLYFKDDDSRLSFLQGNYITLTNMKEADIDDNMLALKSMEALEKVAQGKSTKLVLPSEAVNFLGTFKGIKEVLSDAKDNSEKDTDIEEIDFKEE